MKTKLLMYLAMLIFASNFSNAQIVYVDQLAAGANNGSSWQDAYTSLPTAFSNASDGQEFWIKSDTYIPPSQFSPFVIQHNIELYGGFIGTETLRNQRDFRANPTILSGDINQNDNSNAFNDPTRTDNCRIVVRIDGSLPVTFDGLVIEGGHADGTSNPNDRGAAIFKTNTNTGITLRNVTIRNNSSFTLGALYADFNIPSGTGNLTIENSIFENNLARLGASVFVRMLSSGNLDVNISNSLFHDNSTEFIGGNGPLGGSSIYAISATTSSSSIMTTTVNNCTFADNGDFGAGADDTTFVAGKNNQGTHLLHLTNSIFWNNISINGGILSRPVWFSNAQGLADVQTLNNNLDVLSFPGLSDVNTIQLNPLFVNPGQNDYSLQTNSPAIDSGDNTFLTSSNTVDLAGNNRIDNTIVDIGAYELQGSTNCFVNIPDANFKNILLSTPTLNTNGNNQIECSEATAYTGLIAANFQGITDLTGIEAFENITALYANGNSLTSADLSQNTALEIVELASNQLTNINLNNLSALETIELQFNQLASIDVSQNIALENLILRDNVLSTIDVTNNPNLMLLDLRDNQIGAIDLSTNVNLINLFVRNNLLTQLDVTQNILLEGFNAGDNNLTSIDLSQNSNLSDLRLFNNALTAIDVSSSQTLSYFAVNNNQLTSIDLSANQNLTFVSVGDNDLNNLDLRNGNNTAINSVSFYATNNPNLTCISVDDLNHAITNWTIIDSQTTFSLACSNSCFIMIPDTNFKNALLANTAINTNGNNEIECSEASDFYGTLNIAGQSITDLTGIEFFTNIVEVNASNNPFSTLDLTSNSFLEIIRADSCPNLANVDITQCANLREFYHENAATRSGDNMGKNIQSRSPLTTINFLGNPNLETLFLSDTDINMLDLSQNIILENLRIFACTQLTNLDLSSNASLVSANLFDNALASIDLSNSIALTYLNLRNNPLQVLDISACTQLQSFFVDNTEVVSLDITANPNIVLLSASNNNQLNWLDLRNGNNTSVGTSSLYIQNTPNLTCVSVDDVSYATSVWTNVDSQISFSTNCSLGIDNFELNKVDIFPNPAISILNVDTDLELQTIDIYNLQGQKIISTIEKTIDVKELSDGMYILKLQSITGETLIKRFIKD